MLAAGGTFALFKSFLPAKCNINTTFVDISDLAAIKAAITSKTKVLTLLIPASTVQDRQMAHDRERADL